MTRSQFLRESWQQVTSAVAARCVAHGRDPADVTVIAVTKGWPASDIIALAEAGVSDVGESRDADAKLKRQQLESAGVTNLRWHAIGQVQTNKARSVSSWADVIHSVDRLRLITALAAVERPCDVLIQVRSDVVSSDGAGRAGTPLEDAVHLAQTTMATGVLTVRGLMIVADPTQPAQAQFEAAATVWHELRQRYSSASIFSAGMSGDFDAAIAAGATHLRIGTAILGDRV